MTSFCFCFDKSITCVIYVEFHAVTNFKVSSDWSWKCVLRASLCCAWCLEFKSPTTQFNVTKRERKRKREHTNTCVLACMRSHARTQLISINLPSIKCVDLRFQYAKDKFIIIKTKIIFFSWVGYTFIRTYLFIGQQQFPAGPFQGKHIFWCHTLFFWMDNKVCGSGKMRQQHMYSKSSYFIYVYWCSAVTWLQDNNKSKRKARHYWFWLGISV